MAATSLQELFVEELRDMYDAEKRLLRALPKMARAAEPRGKKCDGMIGIVEEGNHAMDELDGPVLDAALIAGAQKAEHYEIFAELLGHEEAKDLLGETVDEEKAAALLGNGGDGETEDDEEEVRGPRASARTGRARR
jgi:ferritin-like metal-binding protein YciE